MAKGRLTKTSVEQAPVVEQDSYLWDEDLSGFGLKVTPAGRKVYLVQYRIGGRAGRTRRITIGQHGAITPHEARKRAKGLLGDVHAGRDPAVNRASSTTSLTLQQALQRFVDEHVLAKLKPKTALEYQRLLTLHIPANLKRRPLSHMSRADIATLHHGLRDRPYQANRLTAVLSKFFA